MTTAKPTTETIDPNTVDAHVIVTPGGVGTLPDTGNDRGFKTQTMDRAEYAARLAVGATPVMDTLLSDEPDTTVAITDPVRDSSPAPGVIPVQDNAGDLADGGVVEVEGARAGFNPPSAQTVAQTKAAQSVKTGGASAKPAAKPAKR